jgi:hypothetical protein
MALVPCPSCSRLVRAAETACPFCAARGASSVALFAGTFDAQVLVDAGDAGIPLVARGRNQGLNDDVQACMMSTLRGTTFEPGMRTFEVHVTAQPQKRPPRPQ